MTVPEIIYFVFVFVAAVGVLQITASVNDLKGLLITKNKLFNLLIGVALLLGAFLWFSFISGGYVLPRVEGLQQSIIFSLASVAAILVTVLLASLVHLREPELFGEVTGGLDALKRMTYWQVIRARLNRQALSRDKVMRR